MEIALALGFDRILSSGGKASVQQGTPLLSELYKQAANRIEIMAGAGLTIDSIQAIHRETGITSFHTSCSTYLSSNLECDALGFSDGSRRVTDTNLIRAYLAELSRL